MSTDPHPGQPTGTSPEPEKSTPSTLTDEPSGANHDTKDAPADPASELEISTSTKTLIIVSVFLTMFLVSLDRTIISTAVPSISNEFHSLSDVGWYGSAYLLTCCAFQLLFGKVYTVFSTKVVFLASTFLFEVGSVISGAAPNSVAFIVGRAVCGVGSAGIFAGTIVTIISIVPLHQRPKIQGAFGALFGIASIVGPLIGGAFTSNVTWRWCFYVNLPIGGVAMLVVALFMKVPGKDSNPAELSLGQKILQLDLIGTAVLVPGVVCLLLALQWGGQAYPWSNPRIIALLTISMALLIFYTLLQTTILSPTQATIPRRLFSRRTIPSALWATFTINAGQIIIIYFLPIWFQAVLGVSPVDSGLRLLPVMLATVVGSILGGVFNSKVGYYTPLAIVGSCITAVGAGLLTTLQVDSGQAVWIGYQVVYGFGLGSSFQIPNLSVQAALPKGDVPLGMALMFFGGFVGSTVFVSVGENVLANQLVRRLEGFPGFEARLVNEGGVTGVLEALPAKVRGEALVQYNEALRAVFQVGLIVTCLTILGTASLEWLSVKKPQEKADDGEKGGEKKLESEV
ncbi:major facilitator superfamily domain-containing protein [Dichotomopilus funicola]|uniref:Major facilitator superfamily domain-containing protein n=1 Tax=Dichotomopilus funicola TaxID=1934379 RepID=A0AAN6UUX5_9PEZI|nr:major facilitator superfamily domain-containing protein [Dichotomopilus funicola]